MLFDIYQISYQSKDIQQFLSVTLLWSIFVSMCYLHSIFPLVLLKWLTDFQNYLGTHTSLRVALIVVPEHGDIFEHHTSRDYLLQQLYVKDMFANLPVP